MSNDINLGQHYMDANSAPMQSIDTGMNAGINILGGWLDKKFAEWRGQMSEDMAGIKQGIADMKAAATDNINNLKSRARDLMPGRSPEIEGPSQQIAMSPELSASPGANKPITANLSQKDLASVEDLKSKHAFTAVDFGTTHQEVESQATRNHGHFLQQQQSAGMAMA